MYITKIKSFTLLSFAASMYFHLLYTLVKKFVPNAVLQKVLIFSDGNCFYKYDNLTSYFFTVFSQELIKSHENYKMVIYCTMFKFML